MKTLFTILSLISVLLVFPQTQKIEGIGMFKIGKSTTKIIDTIKTQLNYFGNNLGVLETNIDTSSTDPTYFCQGYRQFLIVSGIIIAGEHLEYVHLTFYNDTLIRFDCNYNHSLEKLLINKYGNGIIKDYSKTVPCTYKLTGRTINEYETYKVRTWRNGDIVATMKEDKRLNYQCQIEDNSLFYIELSTLFSKLDAINKKETSRIKAKNLAKKLDKL